jgi:transcriptional regulator with XRE-family HTH domain
MDNQDEVIETEDLFRIKPDSSSDPAGEAGWFMQRERERRGISLEAAGEACGVHPHHLSAIEAGDMTNMPERAESLAMIGAYAQYLGFEPEPLLAHFAAILPKPELVASEPMTTSHPANPGWLSSAKIIKFGRPRMPTFKLDAIPGGATGLIASSFAAIMVFAGASWYLSPSTGTPMAAPEVAAVEEPIVDEPPPGDVKIAEAPMPDVTTPADDAQASDFAIANAEEEAGTGLEDLSKFIERNVEGDLKPEPAQTATTEPIPEPASGGREFGTENAASRLSLKAKAPVWVRVEDTQGNVVMTQMLMTGDVYRVPERDDLIVIARDGGLIAYEIDGKEKGVLGPPGEILVGRPLTMKELDKKG